MQQVRRNFYLSVILLLICLIGGCARTRPNQLPFSEAPLRDATDRSDRFGRSSLADPAVRRNTDLQSLSLTEPIAGGVYLPSLTNSITDTKPEEASLLPSSQSQNVGSDQVPEPARLPTPTQLPTAMPQVSQPTATSLPKQANRLTQTTNILVLGSDRRPMESNWRTDVIMILGLDATTGKAGVISFPRDIYIEDIPGFRSHRINVIDYVGERSEPGSGPKLVGQILSERLGLPIHHYIRFDFDSFKEIVDALDGVQIKVDCAIYDQIEEEDLYIDLAPGEHILNGDMALSYVRTRRQGGDLERIRRQQRFIWALRQQFLEQNWLAQLSTLYTTFANEVQSDIGPLEAISLVQFALNVTEEDVHGLVISPPALVEQSWRDGMFVFDADWPLIAQTMETVFERPPFVTTNTVGPSADQPICPP